MNDVFVKRIELLREKLKEHDIDALLVSGVYNVSYFTGTKGNDCRLLITADKAVIITDFRYREMAQSLSWLEYFETSLSVLFTAVFKAYGCERLGVESDYLSFADYIKIKDAFNGEIVPVSGIIEELRAVKDEDELARIAAAEKLGDDAFMHLISGFIKEGVTESEVAAELEYYLRSHGAQGLSFDTIAISGPNTSYPHGVPSDRKLRNGDFMTLDFGCIYQGYCSDMTRTIAIGQVPDEMKKVYNVVLKAQLAACERIKAGLSGIECDAIARDIIDQAGYGEYFGHSLGHGVGLQVHELPRFNKVWNRPIPENSVVSIEPGIYLPGRFGVRIEDLAIVKKDGIINLAYAPKELIVL